MNLKTRIGKILEWPAKFLANGAHAQQDIPSQHRLLNAAGMFAGWWMMDQLRHAAFGVRQKTEGEYVDVPIEEVPFPLRFLHKSIEWDPHSDSADNQWKKLAYQMLPGIGAGIGAVGGSMYAFERNGRAQANKAFHLKGIQKLNLLDLDYVAQYSQSTPLRVLSGFFGTFSSASGLTYLYGIALTTAFASANGGKIFAGALSKGNFSPHRAVGAQLDMVGSYIQDAMKTGKLKDEWAEQFTERVLQPLFGHELKTPEAQAQAVKTLQGIVEKSYEQYKASGKSAKEIAEAVTKDLTEKLSKDGLDKTLIKEFGLDPKHARVGNANPLLWQFHEYLESMGVVKPLGKNEAVTKNGLALPLVGAGAAVGLATMAPKSKSDGDASPTVEPKHPVPEVNIQKPEEYVRAAMTMHQTRATNQGQPPDWLKWVGNAQLAVLPWNRMCCAIGLTTGLMVAGNMAKIATGYGLDKKPVELAKVPTYLQWIKGIVKDYNPKGLRPRDRWINYAQWGVYSLGGLIGVKIGTNIAFSNVYKKNKDPQYLEDYLPRVSMHQGDTWSWLAATAGMFASSAGLFVYPVPGLNYGLSLASRTTSMQDRSFMLPGLHETMSGSKTTSYLRLREGLNYLCHYAVGNPAQTPAEFEYLAYTMLGPIFKDQLTVDHIKRFTEAVHETRDQFWQEGGIPKAKRKEALKTMKEVFTGAGLEALLIDMGLNPGAINFNELNGLSGKIGNIGAGSKIQAEQDAYQKALGTRLEKYVTEGFISQERADWVKEGIEKMKRGEKVEALTPEPKEGHESLPPPGSFPEQKAPLVEAAPEPKPFAERVKRGHIENLIDKADNKGDWRKEINLKPSTEAPMVIGG